MISDKEVSDHHAIIPTMEIEKADIKACLLYTSKYVIGSGSFRLLIGDLYDLYCYHFILTRRLAEAADEKALLKIQKSVSGYCLLYTSTCKRKMEGGGAD